MRGLHSRITSHESLDTAILRALFAEPRSHVSGVDLATQLGVTRAAIWKHIEQLQTLGYPIEAQPQLGYRLADPIPDLLCADEILARITHDQNSAFHLPPSANPPVTSHEPPITWRPLVFHSTYSTMDLVAREATQGAHEGLLILADHQTGGRGRRGRLWSSSPGQGLYLSLLLRPDWPVTHASRLTIITSLAAAEAIETLCSVRVQIKWPNDLFIGGKKLGGILTEIQSDPEHILSAVIGLGLNIHQRVSDFPEAIRPLATSLYLQTKTVWRRVDLLLLFLKKMEDYYHADFPAVRAAWTDRCLSLGKNLTIETPRGRRMGQALGLDEQGALLLRNEAGQTEIITAGDII